MKKAQHIIREEEESIDIEADLRGSIQPKEGSTDIAADTQGSVQPKEETTDIEAESQDCEPKFQEGESADAGKESSSKKSKHQLLAPFAWVPSLYLFEGLPYVIITVLTVVFYKEIGLDNTEAAFYTSWLYLPWVIKPFWSPFVDMFKTKRWWILSMELLMGAGFAGIGLSLSYNVGHLLAISLVIFWLIAFSSATHDVAADGFYIIGLNTHQQSFFVGIRNTFYRISLILGQGMLLLLAGVLEKKTGSKIMAWANVFYIASALLIALHILHGFTLPKPEGDQTSRRDDLLQSFSRTFYKFITKKHIVQALLFILLFRLGEAQLGKISQLFMLDPVSNGGLGLSKEQVGLTYGTYGIIALTIGGLLGGWLVSRDGLKKWFAIMTLCMNVPNIVYVYMAYVQPSSMLMISTLVCLEQFGYGFGFTAFMLYLLYFSRGQYKTTFYAICTGFMALGMMLPGMAAGFIQSQLQYPGFFIWVCICTIPGFIIARTLHFDDNFGKKE